jgi:hypothetical protein
MCNRNWIYALPLTILFALQATSSYAQEAIGKATSVIPQATGSHAGAFQVVRACIRKRRFAPGNLVRRIYNLRTTAISKWAQIRACTLISSSTTRTNRPVLSPSKQRVARFVLWQDHKVVAPCRSRPLMAPLACVVEVAPVHAPLIDILG